MRIVLTAIFALVITKTAYASPLLHGGYDITNDEHVEVITDYFAYKYIPENLKPEGLQRIEYCLASSRFAFSFLSPEAGGDAWATMSFINLAWEKAAKRAATRYPSLSQLYEAKSRADWPLHLRSVEFIQGFRRDPSKSEVCYSMVGLQDWGTLIGEVQK